ncbi:MAG: hypothetical protein KDK10_14965 [Maritimibacter sp.]|nr:hypothetical protein [Maritimibacter sp.]
MWRLLFHVLTIVLLTLLTQIGGLAWLVALPFKRRLPAFLLAYALLALAAIWIAPHFGRVALSCTERGPLQVQSWMYCAMNRTYVAPELADVLAETAGAMDRAYPGTKTLVLDAGFPFFDGFPLLPHLSHDDGGKADIALYYADGGTYLPGKTRSPIGYFAFEPGPTECPAAWPSLRWNLAPLQALWPAYELDEDRTRRVLQTLAADRRVASIFIEPHLSAHLGVTGEKIRFQGCRAARHDDHIHLQTR